MSSTYLVDLIIIIIIICTRNLLKCVIVNTFFESCPWWLGRVANILLASKDLTDVKLVFSTGQGNKKSCSKSCP